MKFSVGDIVKVRQTGEEGQVVEITHDGYVRVRFQQQVIPIEEAALDFPYLDWFLKQREEDKKIKKKQYIDNLKVEDPRKVVSKYAFPEGFYLIFQPVFREIDGEDLIHRFNVFVYNQTDTPLDYWVHISVPKEKLFSYEGNARVGQDALLYTLNFDDATDNPSFDFEFTPKNGKKDASTFQRKIKLHRKILIEKVHQLQLQNVPLFEWQVFDKLTPADEKIDLPVFKKISSPLTILGTKKTLARAKPEIDLHIEKIYTKFEKLSNAEILQIQLDYFTIYLDLALASTEVNPLRVIHGIGDGVLKNEINRICKQTNGVLRYVYEGYNPGVTLIYFKN